MKIKVKQMNEILENAIKNESDWTNRELIDWLTTYTISIYSILT